MMSRQGPVLFVYSMSQTVYHKVAVDQSLQKTQWRNQCLYSMWESNNSHPRVACVSIWILMKVNTSAQSVVSVV